MGLDSKFSVFLLKLKTVPGHSCCIVCQMVFDIFKVSPYQFLLHIEICFLTRDVCFVVIPTIDSSFIRSGLLFKEILLGLLYDSNFLFYTLILVLRHNNNNKFVTITFNYFTETSKFSTFVK